MYMSFSIQAHELHFNYGESTQVFENHSIDLEVESTQKNKLYGIIGPSGTGKTTLLSIFGGQLNPSQGEILINDVNIYQVTDNVRRSLIALQMQTATSLRGKLRQNIIFGLPETTDGAEPLYTDEELIELLKKVGLWGIFKDKDGLETLIGEGGLNLSGGQRQRLNFAGLYLRAKHYNTQLILIDEPTSSLDEISEKAITEMINELAEQALTLVVAHRLKTLEEAVAIFDSSLISQEKQLGFYTREELLVKSQYFRDLMSGKAVLEE
jgi:ABC-type multidrug transport system fused ATPase/permease subunit